MADHRLPAGLQRYTGAPEPVHRYSDDLRALVTLSRTQQADCGQRQVLVRLDSGPKVRMMFGDSFTVEVPPGAHHLRVHNTLFWKNVWFTIEPGEHLDFLIRNEARWWTYGMVAVLGSAPLFLRIERRSRV